jgi:hypothetical protein
LLSFPGSHHHEHVALYVQEGRPSGDPTKKLEKTNRL